MRERRTEVTSLFYRTSLQDSVSQGERRGLP
jgi:hypothetical protein